MSEMEMGRDRTPNPCGREDLRIALGALVLDALDADEAREVRRHMAECAECQVEYTSLLGVRALMDIGFAGGAARADRAEPWSDAVSASAGEAGSGDPRSVAGQETPWSGAGLGAGLLGGSDTGPTDGGTREGRWSGASGTRSRPVVGGRARDTRETSASRRRGVSRGPERESARGLNRGPGRDPEAPRRSGLVIALSGITASLVIVAAATVFTLARHDDTETTYAATRTVVATNAEGIKASIDFRQAPWGTWLQVTMSNVPSDYKCTLLVVGTDGRREFASSWSSDPRGGSFTVPGGAAMQPSSIDYFDVALAPGYDMKIPVPRSGTGS